MVEHEVHDYLDTLLVRFVSKYWMAFGLDGFRLDAVKHIYMQNELTGVGKTLSSEVVKDDDDSYNHDRKRNINFCRRGSCLYLPLAF